MCVSVPREQLLQTEEYDLNVVRLCIQVFLQDENGQYTRPLNPIITNPIYDNSKHARAHTLVSSFLRSGARLSTHTVFADSVYQHLL